MTSPRATIKSRIEQALLRKPGRTASLDALLQDLPDLTRDQLRSNLSYLKQQGRVVNQGTQNQPAWMLVAPIARCDLGELSAPKPAAPTQPKAAPVVIWPDHVKVQRSPSPFKGEPYRPSKTVYQRPEGDDNLKHPSRRGDERVMPGQPAAMCVGALKDRRSHDKGI